MAHAQYTNRMSLSPPVSVDEKLVFKARTVVGVSTRHHEQQYIAHCSEQGQVCECEPRRARNHRTSRFPFIPFTSMSSRAGQQKSGTARHTARIHNTSRPDSGARRLPSPLPSGSYARGRPRGSEASAARSKSWQCARRPTPTTRKMEDMRKGQGSESKSFSYAAKWNGGRKEQESESKNFSHAAEWSADTKRKSRKVNPLATRPLIM